MKSETPAIDSHVSPGPRITEAHIKALIKRVNYFSAAEGVQGARLHGTAKMETEEDAPLNLLTFCVLTLQNDFTVVGQSACASPENYNRQVGEEWALKDAISHVWRLEGYLLRQALYEQSNP